MNNVKDLYDDSDKRLCPKKCTRYLNGLTTSINSLLNRIILILSDRLTELEEKRSCIMQPLLENLFARIQRAEEKLKEQGRSIQSILLLKYSDCLNRLNTLTNSDQIKESQEVVETDYANDKIDYVDNTTKEDLILLKDDVVNNGKSIEQSYEKLIATTYSTNKEEVKRTKCEEIDFCAPLYVWFNQKLTALNNAIMSISVENEFLLKTWSEVEEEKKKKLGMINDRAGLYYDKGKDLGLETASDNNGE